VAPYYHIALTPLRSASAVAHMRIVDVHRLNHLLGVKKSNTLYKLPTFVIVYNNMNCSEESSLYFFSHVGKLTNRDNNMYIGR